jgi:uncharacterized membrane protein
MRARYGVVISIVVLGGVLTTALLVTRERAPSGDPRALPHPDSAAMGPAAEERVSLAGEASAGAGDAPELRFAAAAPRKFERRFLFQCGDEQFFVRIGESEAALLPGSSLTGDWVTLRPVGSEWRGRYATTEIVFRKDGDAAGFEIEGLTFTDCVGTRDRAHAGDNAVMFQAFGSAPDWTFEITAQDMTLTTAPGTRPIELPLREPLNGAGRVTFRSAVGTQVLVATLDRVSCYDAPSNETFDYAVAITFDDEWYYGCGRFIRYR